MIREIYFNDANYDECQWLSKMDVINENKIIIDNWITSLKTGKGDYKLVFMADICKLHIDLGIDNE